MSNMKQQITIKVPMSGEKNRSKVLTIVAKTQGVTSVAIKGPDGDWIVVTGKGVDSIELTRSIRKKLGDATIVSVHNVNERQEDEEARCCYATTSSSSNYSSYNHCDQNYYSQSQPQSCPPPTYYYYSQQPQDPAYYKVVEYPYPSYNNCSIM